MKKLLCGILVVILVLTIFIGCGETDSPTNPVTTTTTTVGQTLEVGDVTWDEFDVSMIQLIANPEKYDGKFVRVIGVGNIEFEGNCISLSKEDLKYRVGNSIWIELGKDFSYKEVAQYNGEYVIVEGIFDKDDRGHLGMFYGSIKQISRYELWNNFIGYVNVMQNIDKTYSYDVTDYDGRVLVSEENITERPKQAFVSADVVGIMFQYGTGPSTNEATYYDLENGRVSKTFSYVLTAKNGYVVCADYRNKQHIIIVQDIFDKDSYYKEYVLEDVSSSASVADVIIEACFTKDLYEREMTIDITYLAGDDSTEKTIKLKI